MYHLHVKFNIMHTNTHNMFSCDVWLLSPLLISTSLWLWARNVKCNMFTCTRNFEFIPTFTVETLLVGTEIYMEWEINPPLLFGLIMLARNSVLVNMYVLVDFI